MSKYVILTQGNTPAESMMRGLVPNRVIARYFRTHEEAVEHAKSLQFDVTIYQAVTDVVIKHDINPVKETEEE